MIFTFEQNFAENDAKYITHKLSSILPFTIQLKYFFVNFKNESFGVPFFQRGNMKLRVYMFFTYTDDGLFLCQVRLRNCQGIAQHGYKIVPVGLNPPTWARNRRKATVKKRKKPTTSDSSLDPNIIFTLSFLNCYPLLALISNLNLPKTKNSKSYNKL